MPLVLFVGVDGEGRTVLLGAGLLADEQTDSYTWLLRQLAAAGYGLSPGVIFTDGDLVFPDAIASVFPSTRHLLCAWHLSQSIIKAIAGPLGSSARDLMCAFSRCRKIEAADAFERAWQAVLTAPALAPAADCPEEAEPVEGARAAASRRGWRGSPMPA
jgi:transposase-like protein